MRHYHICICYFVILKFVLQTDKTRTKLEPEKILLLLITCQLTFYF